MFIRCAAVMSSICLSVALATCFPQYVTEYCCLCRKFSDTVRKPGLISLHCSVSLVIECIVCSTLDIFVVYIATVLPSHCWLRDQTFRQLAISLPLPFMYVCMYVCIFIIRACVCDIYCFLFIFCRVFYTRFLF